MTVRKPRPVAARRGALRASLAIGSSLSLLGACAGWPNSAPQNRTDVVLTNNYPTSATTALVIYDAYWQVSFAGNPIVPGASSAALPAVPTSGDSAYVVLAPGWDPSSGTSPTSFIVLQSRSTYALALDGVLTIPVDDTGFEGNCAAGSLLTQEQADFLTQIVFAGDFAGFTYDPSSCTTAATGDGAAAFTDRGALSRIPDSGATTAAADGDAAGDASAD